MNTPGKYWKSLSREQRQEWEAKAIVALAEHRKKYPDWRFRTTTSLSKVKDGPKRKNNKKARGEADKKSKNREKSLRCEKIADLLVAGKTGLDLEAAIRKYDDENEDKLKVKEEGCTIFPMKAQENLPVAQGLSTPAVEFNDHVQFHSASDAQNLVGNPLKFEVRDVPQVDHDSRFCTPLTSMFRRSSSAPASETRVHTGETVVPGVPYLGRRESISLPFPSDSHRTASSPPYLGHEVAARVGREADAMLNVGVMRNEEYRLTTQQQPSLTSTGVVNASWNDVSHALDF